MIIKCIIVYKPVGIESPTWATLHNCFDYNSDGAGFMYAENGKVYIQKGFMSWNSFKRAFKPFKNRTDLPLVIHFRITTHGGTEKGLCHPFPLSSKTEELKATKSETEIGIAHNGFISMTSYASKGASDTSEFIRKYASTIITNPQWYQNPNANRVLAEVIGSKMLVLSNDGHGEVVGSGWIEENGVMFSNNSYTYDLYHGWYNYSLNNANTKNTETKQVQRTQDYYDSWDYDSEVKQMQSNKGYYDAWGYDDSFHPTYCKFWFTDEGEATCPSKECEGCCDYKYCWE